MADGGSSAVRKKQLPNKLPEAEEVSLEYIEATDFVIDKFQNTSVCGHKERIPVEDDAWSWGADSVEMQMPRVDDRNMDIMRTDLTWEQKVVKVLNMIRCKGLTEYNHKLQIPVPTRFCLFNIALFDLDEESQIEPRPLLREIPASDYWKLENSVNLISIKVAVSDVGYPVNIFGTVLARDQVDYRCVYLFKRGRDNPQLIKSPVDTLTLTGPGRALAVTDTMYFEFHLKIKDDEAVDKDFCKGLLEHNTARHTIQPMNLKLESWLSTVELAFTLVPFAVEASLTVSILKGPSTFIGNIVAWTSGNDKNEIILYDSQVAGTQRKLGTDGSIVLTRYIVAVPLDEDLVLNVSLCGSDEAECMKFIIGNDVETCTNTIGPYELQVKVVWRGIIKQRRPNMWEYFGGVRVLR
ncbi:unnamed protein product [Urochloa decumbens]|uniref:DUF6598 domain-containing protein n=1 Tax=Urochloa decumbens TaxID=240449 RepID=A0ABC8XN39_9POAL